MAKYVIIGAGPSGLYTAYRLLSSGKVKAGDTVQIFEWSDRPGGRIYSYTLDKDTGLYAEVGGMRFAADPNFVTNGQMPTTGHILVQYMVKDMGLVSTVLPFLESPTTGGKGRMYYLRGKTLYETSLTDTGLLPYNFDSDFKSYADALGNGQLFTADNILGQLAAVYAPGSENFTRADWCAYFAKAQAPASGSQPGNLPTSSVYPASTQVQNIGYWNLLYDQLGDEGFDYVADANGYTSNVINWNASDAMQANNDYGSGVGYYRLDGGYSKLFEAMAAKVTALGATIEYKKRLLSLVEREAGDGSGRKVTVCAFADASKPDLPAQTVEADYVFLAMPRRSLEMVAAGCSPTHMLNDAKVRLYLESSIDQPSVKVVLTFDKAWWADSNYVSHQPSLASPPGVSLPPSNQVGGPTITDLPLRQVYYFGNNVPGGPGSGSEYVLLASYDDMNYTQFWQVMETDGDYKTAPSLIRQPLTGPTAMPQTMINMIMKQLADVHGAKQSLPAPTEAYFQDWGQDPFGGGYHGWAAHYNICDAMDKVRAPYQKILGADKAGWNVFIVGSCYSFDQAWVEGAFCVAESVLNDFLGVPPYSTLPTGYSLICSGS